MNSENEDNFFNQIPKAKFKFKLKKELKRFFFFFYNLTSYVISNICICLFTYSIKVFNDFNLFVTRIDKSLNVCLFSQFSQFKIFRGLFYTAVFFPIVVLGELLAVAFKFLIHVYSILKSTVLNSINGTYYKGSAALMDITASAITLITTKLRKRFEIDSKSAMTGAYIAYICVELFLNYELLILILK